MESAEIAEIVEGAVRRLLVEQKELLTLNVGEPTISQQLAMYMREAIPESIAIDVEYNRHGSEKKVLIIPPRKKSNMRAVPTLVRPDIVIHQRGNDENNIAVLEVKKPGADLKHDRAKLEAFKRQFQYHYAAHIVVGFKGTELCGEVEWIDR